ncbi:MAG: hypothetical protein PHH28_05675 [Desulfuromonadaceae bacterium]|nr:hypothetical protein [Desulfuromonadaceae bacterium]
MIIKSAKKPLALEHSIDKSKTTVNNPNDNFVFDQTKFDSETASDLQSTFKAFCYENFDEVPKDQPKDASVLEEGFSKSARVKFMITKKDEADLRRLGYNKEQINKLKPQEAVDIIQAGTKLNHPSVKSK